MFNIGFKQMAFYAAAGVVSLMVPSIFLNLAAPLGWFAFAYTALVLFWGGVFVFYPAMKQLNKKDVQIAQLKIKVPKKGAKGRFVKHE